MPKEVHGKNENQLKKQRKKREDGHRYAPVHKISTNFNPLLELMNGPHANF